MKRRVSYVDETGSLGERMLGVGVFEPETPLREKELLEALAADRIEDVPNYLHATDDRWEVKEAVLRWVRDHCPGSFEFTWVDRRGEELGIQSGRTRDGIFDLLVALPLVTHRPTIIELEARGTTKGKIAESMMLKEHKSLEGIHNQMGPLVRTLMPLASINNITIRTRAKHEQTTGLQVADYLCWLRRRKHTKRTEPVSFESIARRKNIPRVGPSWLHYENYLVGPKR